MASDTYTFNNQLQLTSFLENASLYNHANSAWILTGKQKDKPFYYEPSTQTVNFGYGINLSAAASNKTLKAEITTVLATLGVTISDKDWTYIGTKITVNNQATLIPILNNIADSLTTIVEKNSVLKVQNAAETLMKYVLTDTTYSSSTVNELPDNINNFSSLPSWVKGSLEDLYYNSGGGFLGDNIISDLEKNDIASAVYEVAFKTAKVTDIVYERRSLINAAQMLGFQVTFDGDYYIVSLKPFKANSIDGTAGSVNNTTLIKFMQEVATNNPSSFLANDYGSDFFDSAKDYLLTQGYYVPQAASETWTTIAAQIKTASDITISATALQRANLFYSDSSLKASGLIYAPIATQAINTSPKAIEFSNPIAANPFYLYANGQEYAFNPKKSDGTINGTSNDLEIFNQNGNDVFYTLPSNSPSNEQGFLSLDAKGNEIINNPLFKTQVDANDFRDTVSIGRIQTTIDGSLDISEFTENGIAAGAAIHEFSTEFSTGTTPRTIQIFDNEGGKISEEVVTTDAQNVFGDLIFEGHPIGTLDTTDLSITNSVTDQYGRQYFLSGNNLTIRMGSNSLQINNFKLGDFAIGTQTKSSAFGFAGNKEVVQNYINSDSSGNPALQEVQAAINTSGDATILEGAKWDKEIVTWNIGNIADNSVFGHDIQGAFNVWAKSTGIDFVETASSNKADITLGFSNLDSLSGVVGYTNYSSNNGIFTSANISLENPNQDSLINTSKGLTYSGTNATFEQVVEHEIGHAIGFADNNNPNSIMDYYLGSSNQTLSSSDVAAANALYNPNDAGSLAFNQSVSSLLSASQTHHI